MDGRAKIFKENNTAQNRPSLAEMPVTEFRVRCSVPRDASRERATQRRASPKSLEFRLTRRADPLQAGGPELSHSA